MPDYHYGKTSTRRLATAKPGLQQVFKLALELGLMDIAIIQGRRGRAEQDRYYAIGKSRVRWPHSKHNVINPLDLASAVDAAPFVNGEISWRKEHCIYLAGVIQACAELLGVPIRWGGNWDMDGEPITDQDFQDLVHYELVNHGKRRVQKDADGDRRPV